MQQYVSVEVNGYQIDDRIAEYTKQASILESKVDRSIVLEINYEELIGYMNLFLLTCGKLAMWQRVKVEYMSKSKANALGKTVSMSELESLITSVKTIIDRFEQLVDDISENVNKTYDLAIVYDQYRKQKRILNHYENELRICKSQVQSFELESDLLKD